MQEVIVGVIIIIAVVLAVRWTFRAFTQKGNGCHGCPGCHVDNNEYHKCSKSGQSTCFCDKKQEKNMTNE